MALMLQLISPTCYWEIFTEKIKTFAKHCKVCQINKDHRKKRYGFLELIPNTQYPFEIILIEKIGGLNY